MRSVRWGVRADLFFFIIHPFSTRSKSYATYQITYLCGHARGGIVIDFLFMDWPK